MKVHPRFNQMSSVGKHFEFRSVMGRKIPVCVFGDEEPTTLIIGGIHGDEPSGVQLAEELIKKIPTEESFPDFQGRIVMIPVANPDGLTAGTRLNARGVDINRNFPTQDFKRGQLSGNCYPGRQAASEPETKMILKIATIFKPRLILTFHAEQGCVNYDGPAIQIAQAISSENGFPVCKNIGYATPGSLGTYFGVERNIPVITLELLSQDDQWARHGKAIVTAIGMNQK